MSSSERSSVIIETAVSPCKTIVLTDSTSGLRYEIDENMFQKHAKLHVGNKPAIPSTCLPNYWDSRTVDSLELVRNKIGLPGSPMHVLREFFIQSAPSLAGLLLLASVVFTFLEYALWVALYSIFFTSAIIAINIPFTLLREAISEYIVENLYIAAIWHNRSFGEPLCVISVIILVGILAIKTALTGFNNRNIDETFRNPITSSVIGQQMVKKTLKDVKDDVTLLLLCGAYFDAVVYVFIVVCSNILRIGYFVYM